MYLLHTMPDSAGTAVHIALLELGQPFVMTVIDREADTRDQPGYRELHPWGQVPALETPDGPIFETAAILLWLADRHGGGLAPAPDSAERGQFLKWLFFTSTNIHATVMCLFYPNRYTGDPAANPAFLRTNARRLEDALARLNQAVSKHPSWCPPDGPSALGDLFQRAAALAGADGGGLSGPCRSGALPLASGRGADAGGATRRAERRAGRGAGRDDLFGTGGLTRMFLSVFDMFKVGVGPSSSHTMGPMVAAARFLDTLRASPFHPAGLRASLHGSLAFTGVGHATDRATILGLAGFEPATYDAEKAEAALAAIRDTHVIHAAGPAAPALRSRRMTCCSTTAPPCPATPTA